MFRKCITDIMLTGHLVNTSLKSKWCNIASSSSQQFTLCFLPFILSKQVGRISKTGASTLAPTAAICAERANMASFFKLYSLLLLKVWFSPFTAHPTVKQQVSFMMKDPPLPSG